MLELLWIPILSGALTLPPPQPQPARVAPPADRPFAHLVQNLGRDLKSLVHGDTAIIVGTGGALALLAHRLDDNGDRWASTSKAGSWTSIGRVGGDGWIQGGLALGTWGIGRINADPLTIHVGSDLIRAQMLNMVNTRVLKIVFDRQRPSGGNYALPSGHSSAAFTTAAVLHRHFGWKGATPGYALAGFVALTRVRDRAHWVSDTVLGAALGITAGWTVTRGHDRYDWSLTPVVTTNGALLVLRW